MTDFHPTDCSKAPLEIDGQLWFKRDGKAYLGGKRIELLEQIEVTGSINRAAKAVQLSYKGAWNAIEAMNNLSERPLVVRETGGRHGGGTRLTEFGRQMVYTWRRMQAEYERFLGEIARGTPNFDEIDHLLRAIAMKTSARNQLRGEVIAIDKGAVNSNVTLDLDEGLKVVANITNDSVDELQLAPGRTAIALIKASFVLLSPGPVARTSARNRLSGTISDIKPGAVNSQVKLQLSANRTLTAIVTNDSVEELQLATGQECTALIKASHIIIAVD
ncbi:TOBE domain-containing protein [Halomonas sp. MCCC 1A11036]|uniref:TOBE domain-containing protein n=1 Tax=Billgrantia zhangzhouensis TaxID=2733481 RepID=A0ABS9AG73_9GAMM|nr:TOBE domain-containing protein [Halomonas zhangzhouensis]MCE8020724.1 TOBE domain-containing protein [Halomonas zhangzhouensis]